MMKATEKPVKGIKVRTYDPELYGRGRSGRYKGGFIEGQVDSVETTGEFIVSWEDKGMFGAMTCKHYSDEWGKDVKPVNQ